MTKRYILFFLFLNIVIAQVSLNDVGRLSNQQLDILKTELQGNNPEINQPVEVVDFEVQSIPIIEEDNYFGYAYFKRDINFFDNIPTPPDFKLGPGDEIVLSLWGERNSREKFSINKEGLIYYKNIGFINLSNKNLKDAQEVLRNELSQIYATLKDDRTELMLELRQLKSINVYFSGQIENPGINLIHPFSDIFSAIVQVGGLKKQGSLRKVQLIRSNKIIASFDFYSFFKDGKNNFSNTRILDGDIIHIPEVTNRVSIEGEIVNNGFFELLDRESLSSLIDYAGGLTAIAASTAIVDMVTPISERSSDDRAQYSLNVNIKDFSSTALSNGSAVIILPISDVETKVEVLGRVKRPGQYSGQSTTLKEVLDIAGGFDDPLYRKTILDQEITVLRKDEKIFYSLEFHISYDKSHTFDLIPGDKVFVYENSLYNNHSLILVQGEVNKSGSFQLRDGMTIQDAINLAHGFTELGDKDNISVKANLSSIDSFGNKITTMRQVNDATLDFILTDGASIIVLKRKNIVKIEGNVYSPGFVVYSNRQSLKQYIHLAGGFKPNTAKNKMYIQRVNGKIKRVSPLFGLNSNIRPGDTIFVPEDPNAKEFNPTELTSNILAIITNLVAIIAITNNTTN